MHTLKIVLAILFGLSAIVSFYMIGEYRKPITVTTALIGLALNVVIIYALFH